MKILNLYAGIGGNRKLWNGGGLEVIAVEKNRKLAKVYAEFFPDDLVITKDAHRFLLDHYDKFDFIWASPPCQSHSRIRNSVGVHSGQVKPIYADMQLYQEIIFLNSYAKCKWVIENVVSYYKPLIKPQYVGGHYFWSNFPINTKEIFAPMKKEKGKITDWQKLTGFDLSKFAKKRLGYRKDVVLKNCVDPKLGLHVLQCAFRHNQRSLKEVLA